MSKMTGKRCVIGVTGGIATGKSVVLDEIKRRGGATLSADDLAHRCLEKDHPVYRRILRKFGANVLRPDRNIDRRALAAVVFRSTPKRKWLERQIHPYVIREMKRFVRKQHGLVALDIPLLYEARLQRLVDRVLVVSSSQNAQITRLKRRNALSPVDALRRIRAQMPLSAKRQKADDVLVNDGTLGQLRRQVQIWLQTLRRICLTSKSNHV